MFEESVIPSIWASVNSWFTPTVFFVLLNVMIGTIAIRSRSHEKNEDQQQQQQQIINRAPSLLHRLRSINLYRLRSSETPSPTTTTPPDPDPQQQRQQQEDEQIKELDQQQSDDDDEEDEQIKELCQQQSDDDDDEEDEEIKELDQQQSDDEEDEQIKELDQQQSDEEEEEDLGLVLAQVKRSKSDMKPASGEISVRLARKMRKSASLKSAFRHFEEEEEEDEEEEERRRPATVREGKNVMSFGEDNEVDAKADDFINKFNNQLKLQRIDSFTQYKDMLTRGSSR